MTRNVAKHNAAAIEFEENLVIDIQFFIKDAMDKAKVSKADLAKMLGVSKSRLSHIFAPNANVTVRTLAKIAFALGIELSLSAKNSDCKFEFEKNNDWSDAPFEIAPARSSAKLSDVSVWANNDNLYGREHFASDEVEFGRFFVMADAA